MPDIQPTSPKDPFEQSLSPQKIGDAQEGISVQRSKSQTDVSKEIVVSTLKDINPSQISDNQKKTLNELEELAKGAKTALSLLSFLEEIDLENQTEDHFFQTLNTSIEGMETINESLRELLSLATTLGSLSESQKNLIETHGGISDIAIVVSFALRQIIQTATSIQDRRITNQEIETLRDEVRNLEADLQTTPKETAILSALKSRLAHAELSLKKIEENALYNKVETGAALALTLPSITSSVYSAARWLGLLKDFAPITFVLSGAASIAGMATAAIEMDNAIDAAARQKIYLKTLKPQKIELREDSKTFDSSQHLFNELLTKRKTTFENRVKQEEQTFDRFYNELIRKSTGPIETIAFMLKKEGIDLQTLPDGENISTVEELNETMSSNPVFKKALIQQRIDHKDTLTVLTKNLLKSRLLENQKIKRKFFSWNKNKSKIKFSLSVILGAVAIFLSAAVLVGLTIPLFPLAIPSLIAIGFGSGLAICGLMKLYKDRPNLLSELIRGTKIKLAYHLLPHTFQAWRLKKNQARLLQNQAALMFLRAKPKTMEGLKAFRDTAKENIPPTLLSLYNKLQRATEIHEQDIEKFDEKELMALEEEQKKVEAALKSYEEKLKDSEKTIKNLQNRLDRAKQKDFEEKTKFKFEDFELLAEGLVEGEFWQDDESIAFIRSNLGIDLSPYKDQEIDIKTRSILKKQIDKKMRNAILTSSSDLIEWLRTI